jgi:hypothetical protein
VRRRGLHGAKLAYERQQAEAAERARHRELVHADLELDAVEELLDDMWSGGPSRADHRVVDGLGVECRRLRDELAALLNGGARG